LHVCQGSEALVLKGISTMPGIYPNSIGIMPAGALGVAFYYHLTGGNLDQDDAIFLDRPAGEATTSLRRSDSLHIKYEELHDSDARQIPWGNHRVL